MFQNDNKGTKCQHGSLLSNGDIRRGFVILGGVLYVGHKFLKNFSDFLPLTLSLAKFLLRGGMENLPEPHQGLSSQVSPPKGLCGVGSELCDLGKEA